jgi:hypothetical protein
MIDKIYAIIDGTTIGTDNDLMNMPMMSFAFVSS